MAIKRSEKLSTKFGGGKFGVGRYSQKQIIRETKSADTIARSEKLSTKFGGGKFGVGRYSQKQITRTKI